MKAQGKAALNQQSKQANFKRGMIGIAILIAVFGVVMLLTHAHKKTVAVKKIAPVDFVGAVGSSYGSKEITSVISDEQHQSAQTQKTAKALGSQVSEQTKTVSELSKQVQQLTQK